MLRVSLFCFLLGCFGLLGFQVRVEFRNFISELFISFLSLLPLERRLRITFFVYWGQPPPSSCVPFCTDCWISDWTCSACSTVYSSCQGLFAFTFDVGVLCSPSHMVSATWTLPFHRVHVKMLASAWFLWIASVCRVRRPSVSDTRLAIKLCFCCWESPGNTI